MTATAQPEFKCQCQWKVQLAIDGASASGGSPEGTLAWVRQNGCFGADDKVVLASTGREAYPMPAEDFSGAHWQPLATLARSAESE